MSKHTPGPWEICGATHVWSPSAKANIASASALRTIDHVGYAPPEIGDLDEVAANARLIAAAPDLLAALNECAREIFDLCQQAGIRVLPESHEQALAAIAKATE